MKIPIGSEEIFRLPDGDQISFTQLLDDLSMTRVIFVGESHDQMDHHQIQLKIIQGLLERGENVVIAMEMFERSQQPLLDHWSQGLLTEEEFLKGVNWESTWGMDYNLYKGILDSIKNYRLKLIGLNVQRDLVRKVAQDGIEGLSPEDKEKLPKIDLTDQEHRAYIESIYKKHEGGFAKDFEHFYQAQSLWDEGMAETLSQFLQSLEGHGKTALVFAGNGHIILNFGIPNRLHRRTSIPFKTIILKEWRKGIEEDLSFYKTSSPLANFLWITKPTPPGKKGPRIGIVLKEKEDLREIWIEQVIPQSPAEKAGLLPGDQMIAIEGKEVMRLRNLHDAFSQKGWGKDVNITILRKGVKKKITLTLPPLKE